MYTQRPLHEATPFTSVSLGLAYYVMQGPFLWSLVDGHGDTGDRHKLKSTTSTTTRAYGRCHRQHWKRSASVQRPKIEGSGNWRKGVVKCNIITHILVMNAFPGNYPQCCCRAAAGCCLQKRHCSVPASRSLCSASLNSFTTGFPIVHQFSQRRLAVTNAFLKWRPLQGHYISQGQ